MVLGIDASRCGAHNGTGVEAYSTAVVRAILKELSVSTHPKFDEVVLYTPHHLSSEILGGKYSFVRQRVIPFPRLWTQVRLSAEMIHEEPHVLFVPSHVLPLIHADNSVVTIHDVAFTHFPKSYSFFQRKYLTFTTWLTVREAKKIIVPSEATRQDLMKMFKCPEKKIAVVSHGFERDPNVATKRDSELLKEFGLDTRSKYIFYVGRLEEKKNLIRLVRAFVKFKKEFPEWRLILAGNRGFWFEKLFHEVEKHELWESIMMPGYVTDEERSVLYRHCQFVAFVSLAEGFGFPVLEAASFGKRVLASDIPALREVGGGALTYCDPLSEDAIFEGMTKITQLEHSENDSKHKLETLTEKYTWERAGKETLRVLERVL